MHKDSFAPGSCRSDVELLKESLVASAGSSTTEGGREEQGRRRERPIAVEERQARLGQKAREGAAIRTQETSRVQAALEISLLPLLGAWWLDHASLGHGGRQC